MEIRATGIDPTPREAVSKHVSASPVTPQESPEAPVVQDRVTTSRGHKTVKVALHKADKKPSTEAPSAPPAEAKPEAKDDKTVLVRFRPQDDLLPDKKIEMPASDMGKALDGPRFLMQEDPNAFRPPVADKEGNYIFNLDDPRQGAVNAYVSAQKALDVAEHFLGRPINWGFKREVDPQHMWIHPHAGEGLNAFYNSQNGSLNFLYAEDPRTGSLLDAAASLEVVAHETGHAILDGLRPNYLQSLDASSGGYHEAFGDTIAMLSSLSDDDVLEALYQETGGDLSQPNIVSRMGEQLGRAMHGKAKEYVRNNLNDQKYRDSHFLPYFAFPDGPALEPHAYAGVWAGANYDLLRVFTGSEMEDSSKTFIDAVKSARDSLGSLVMRSVEFAPLGKIGYKDAAISMLKADAIDNGGAHLKQLLGVFVGRDILTQDDADKFTTDLALAGQIREEGKMDLPADFNPSPQAKVNGGKQFLKERGKLLGLSSQEIKDLKYVGCVTNDRGERILQYSETQKITLTEPEWGATYQGNSFEIHGGLLLAFDKEGKLETFTRDAITEDHIADARHYLKKMIDFEKNPPIIIRNNGGAKEEGATRKSEKDLELEFKMAPVRKPIEIVDGQIRRSGIVY